MGKIIAVWGCPNSGKTAFCVKLAKAIYDTYASKILCVFPDSVTPTLPVLFPSQKADELRSLGAVLSSAEITPDTVLGNLVTVKDVRDIGVLGYTDGENRYSYAEYAEDKAGIFLDMAASLADFVIVDCGGSLAAPISGAAVAKAGAVFRIGTPGLRTMSFFSSQLPLYGDSKYRLDEQIRVMNLCEQALCLPVEETVQFMKGVQATVPYSKEVARQMMEGNLLRKVGDWTFTKAMKRIVDMVV